MATYSANTTTKNEVLNVTFAKSGVTAETTVFETTDYEYAEIQSIYMDGTAGNGVILRIRDVYSNQVLWTQGSVGSLSNETFQAYLRSACLFMSPNTKLTYQNNVAGTGNVYVSGLKTVNTP